MADVQRIPCKKCDGTMRTKEFNKHSRILTAVIITVGVLFSLTIIGILVGMPLIVFALHLGSQTEYSWVCEKCGEKASKHL